jgi:hypothetical protein
MFNTGMQHCAATGILEGHRPTHLGMHFSSLNAWLCAACNSNPLGVITHEMLCDMQCHDLPHVPRIAQIQSAPDASHKYPWVWLDAPLTCFLLDRMLSSLFLYELSACFIVSKRLDSLLMLRLRLPQLHPSLDLPLTLILSQPQTRIGTYLVISSMSTRCSERACELPQPCMC